jgi:hypothetical protein
MEETTKQKNKPNIFSRTWQRITRPMRISTFARLAALSTLFVVMILLNLATAMAFIQSHNLSEIRNIDANLNMGAYSIKTTGLNITGATNCNTIDTDANGVVSCGTDAVNDADADATNEYPLAGNDIDVSTRTVSLEPTLDFVTTINGFFDSACTNGATSVYSISAAGSMSCHDTEEETHASEHAGNGLTSSVDTLNIGEGHGVDIYADSIAVDETELTCGSIPGLGGGLCDGVDHTGIASCASCISGTSGRIGKFTAGSFIGNSVMTENSNCIRVDSAGGTCTYSEGIVTDGDVYVSGGNIGVGVAPSASYAVYGSSSSTGVYGAGGTTGVYGTGTSQSVWGNGGIYGVVGTGTTGGVGANGGAYGLVAQGTTYAVYGYNSPTGVRGEGTSYGVYGQDNGGAYGYLGSNSYGVYGSGTYGVHGAGTGANGVTGTYGGAASSNQFAGVAGFSGTYGVYGYSTTVSGVYGGSSSGNGVSAISTSGYGLNAFSTTGRGVNADGGTYGVYSYSNSGTPVYGTSTSGTYGVRGVTVSGTYGVHGGSGSSGGSGVYGTNVNSGSSRGVEGVGGPGYGGYFTANSVGGWGIYATGASRAGSFTGNVVISGTCTSEGSDCAVDIAERWISQSAKEYMRCGDDVENSTKARQRCILNESFELEFKDGDVVCIDPSGNGMNILKACGGEFDKDVVSVVSYNATTIFGPEVYPYPVALAGNVPVNVICDKPIRRGDLLVTSAEKGYAMKLDVDDPSITWKHSLGTVFAKAISECDGTEKYTQIRGWLNVG